MPILNKWVGYVDRSYQQIKDSLISNLKVNAPEVTDHSESNILIIIISMFSGIAEMLNYYIDNMAREAFIATARRFSSLVKLSRLLDYRVKAASPASVDITFTFNTPTTGVGIIPIDTMVKTQNNTQFLSISNITVPLGTLSINGGFRQISKINSRILGTTNGSLNQRFSLGLSYVHGSALIKVNNVAWYLVNSLGLSVATDKHFIVEIDTDGIAYVVFGDGINGAIPTSGYDVVADLQETLGELGNVDINTITTIGNTPILPGISSMSITNLNKATGGSGYEDVERIRISAPLSIRTLDRAVTEQDYVDIAKLAPGVGKAKVYFNCGKTVKIYIVPIGGGIAATPLLDSTRDFFEKRRMLTTFLEILPAGQTSIYIELEVTAKFREDVTATTNDIKNILLEYGSYIRQSINKSIRISDIIALVDGLNKVDFVKQKAIYSIPYAFPMGHTNQLNWARKTNSGSTSKQKWSIQWTGSDFILYKGNMYAATLLPSSTYSDGNMDITPALGTYNLGDTWEFYSYPYNADIELDDFSIPFTQLSDLNILVIPQIFQPIE